MINQRGADPEILPVDLDAMFQGMERMNALNDKASRAEIRAEFDALLKKMDGALFKINNLDHPQVIAEWQATQAKRRID